MNCTGRLGLMLLATVFLLNVGMAFAVEKTTTARGVVFKDGNRNGVRDQGERGIAGVCVSNGQEVVKTDRKGRYELSAEEDTVLFVIKPRGWKTPVDSHQIPRFYYVHKPAGSPSSKYAGVPPTGPLPASVDFALERRREPDRFDVVFLGDTQTTNQREVDFFAHDTVEELVGTGAAFGITLGDVANNNLLMLEPIIRAASRIGVPWYNVQGNHDTNQDSPGDRHSDETWERLLGPNYYSFNYGRVHFIVLDSVMWTGAGYHGELGQRQLEFVRNNLEFVPKNRLVVLLMHIPVMEFKDREALFALLADRPHTFSASAHWHTHSHFFLAADEGWGGPEPHHHLVQGTACGGWWSGVLDEYGLPHATMADGLPNGYSVVSFDNNGYTVTFKAPRRPADHQMNIYAPEVVASGDAKATEVVVNVFNGSARSTVEMRLGESGPWIPMVQTDREDPHYLRLKQFEADLSDKAGKKLPGPSRTSHLWAAKLPADRAEGSHLLHVRTTDMFGRTYTSQRVIRVE